MSELNGKAASRERAARAPRFTSRRLLIGFALSFLAMVAILIAVVLESSLQDPGSPGSYSLQGYRNLYSDPFLYRTLGNTVGYVALSTFIALFFAIPIALLVERTTLPGRSLVFPAMVIALLVPGVFSAAAWKLLLHPRIGVLNEWFVDWLPFVDTSPFNIISIPGMGLLSGLGLAPLAFIMLAGTLRSKEAALEECAQVHGLGLFDRLRTIVLPMAWPGLLTTGILITVIALAAREVPTAIGLAGRIFVFSTVVATQGGGAVGASGAFMIVVALSLAWWYLGVINRSYRYTAVTGQTRWIRPTTLSRRQVIAGWSFVGTLLLLGVGVPLLVMVWASLLPFFEPFSTEALGRVSLNNFRSIQLSSGFWTAARNTAVLLAVVPMLLVLIALTISWVVVRSKTRLAWPVDMIAFLPLAIPSVVLAAAAFEIVLFWVPRFIPIYGTLWVIIGVFIITGISFPTRLFNNGLIQIHRELDEAGYVFGLGPLTVLRRILFPLLLPTVLYVWLWVGLLVYREVSLTAVLQSRQSITLSTYVYGSVGGANVPQGAALGLVVLAVVTPLVTAYLLWARRRMEFGS